MHGNSSKGFCFRYLLSYLIGHDSLINGFRLLVTPIDDRTSSIWSFCLIQGRPLCRLLQILASNARLGGISCFIQTRWPATGYKYATHRLCRSLLDRMRLLSPTCTEAKSSYVGLLSNTPKAAESVLHSSAINKLIDGFRACRTYSSSCLCFLGAYVSWYSI